MPPRVLPEKERISVTFRLPREVVRRLDTIAKQEFHSRSQLMEMACRRLIETRTIGQKAA